MGPGADEMVRRTFLAKESDGQRIKIDIGQANSRPPFHVPMRVQAELPAAVIEIDGMHIKPALEKTIVAEIKIRNDIAALGDQETVRKQELPKALGKTVAQLETRRSGPIELSRRQVYQVREKPLDARLLKDRAVDGDRSLQAVLDLGRDHVELQGPEAAGSRGMGPIQKRVPTQERTVVILVRGNWRVQQCRRH